MSTFTTVLSFILLLIFLLSGVIITSASINLGALKDTSTFFANAYYYSTWAAALTWCIVAITILSVAGYYILGWVYEAEVPEAAILQSLQKNTPSSSWSGWSILFLIIILILVVINGCLAAAAASQIASDPNYNPNNTQQYRAKEEAIITAILCLTSAGLLLVWGIVETYYYFSPEEPEVKIIDNIPTTAVASAGNTDNNTNMVNKVNNLTPEDIEALKKLLGK